MNLIIDDTDHPLIIKVASIQSARMQIYFIDNEDFFQRKYTVRDGEGNEFEDNDERSIFYVRGVMETVKKLRWMPDLIHCHGWLTALAPLYIKKHYKDDPCFKNSKIVYSVYDDDFQMPFRDVFHHKLKLEGIKDTHLKSIKEKANFETLSKLAIDFSDGVIQGAPVVNADVVEYAKAKEGLRYLPYHDRESYIDAFNTFYDKILEPK